MDMLPRHLITSSDEKTWKLDRPVIFLSDWFLLDSRRQIWETMDYKVVTSPYSSVEKGDAEYKRERAIEDEIFPKFCAVLNETHGTTHDERFWKILLGHWFRRYTHLIYNRLRTLEACLNSDNIVSAIVFTSSFGTLVSKDSSSFGGGSVQDENWNDLLLGKLFEFLDTEKISMEYMRRDLSKADIPLTRFSKSNSVRRKETFYKLARNWAKYFTRDTDALIINSYLPLIQEFRLELYLGQFPQWWITPKLDLKQSADLELRARLAGKLTTGSQDNVENAIYSLLFELLPLCYLEGFSSLLSLVEELRWPKRPKFIFTSNNYDSDEVFKLWAAIKTEEGVPYIIGQHGNNYRTSRYANPSVEEESCDVFITWGRSDNEPRYAQAFNFKTVGKSQINTKTKDKLLLVELASAANRSFDGSSFETYFNDQKLFVNSLGRKPRQNLMVRLYQPHVFTAGNELVRWHAFDINIKIDAYSEFWKLANQSRLLVFSYDSTGVLEALALNLPLIAFWQDGLDHLRDNAKPFYEEMIQAGIFHLNPESAAHKVNEVWGDIDDWWMTAKVQNAREAFCSQYSRTSKKPIRDLKKILLVNI